MSSSERQPASALESTSSTRLHPVSLRFEGELERRFRDHHFDAHHRYQFWVLGIAALLYAGNALADLQLLPQQFKTLLVVRAVAAAAIALPMLAIFSSRRRQLQPKLVGFATLSAGLSYSILVWSAPASLDHLYHYGLFPIVMAIYTVTRLGYLAASAASLLSSATLIAVVVSLKMQPELVTNFCSNLIPLNVLGIATAYAMERYERVSFLKSHLLEQSQSSLREEIEHRKATALQLQAASERAEEANRSKSDFLAKMSHEIRTPMNGVIGMNELLLTSKLDEAQREMAETVKGSGQALLRIINDILDFSKIESNHMRLYAEPMNLRKTVSDVIQLLAVQADKKGLVFGAEFLNEPPDSVMGDAGRLRQILLNLVGNALKFTDEGHVDVTVSYQVPETVTIEVTDTGPGIRQDDIARLFDPFEQLENRSQGGTGLGLAIARQLVVLMGGDLTVRSAEGEGSCFSFTACLPQSATPLAKNVVSPLQTFAVPPLVLVAEDNPVNQSVLVGFLTRMGCDIVVVGDGAKAVAATLKQNFDIVLMDIRMPHMGGEEAARLIWQQPGRQGLPIIALTADVGQGVASTTDGRSITDYLYKPVEPALLFTKIDSALRSGNAPQSETSKVAPLQSRR